jgi:hypothetical protein
MVGRPTNRCADAWTIGHRPVPRPMMTNGNLCHGACLDSGHHRRPHDPGPDSVSPSSPTAGHHRPFPIVEDQITWKWSSSRQYSSNSAYAVMFYDQSVLLGAKEQWKFRAPNDYRFFFWLAIQNRCWTSERLTRHGLRNNRLCTLCD